MVFRILPLLRTANFVSALGILSTQFVALGYYLSHLQRSILWRLFTQGVALG